jgi:hypothetical protein
MKGSALLVLAASFSLASSLPASNDAPLSDLEIVETILQNKYLLPSSCKSMALCDNKRDTETAGQTSAQEPLR